MVAAKLASLLLLLSLGADGSRLKHAGLVQGTQPSGEAGRVRGPESALFGEEEEQQLSAGRRRRSRRRRSAEITACPSGFKEVAGDIGGWDQYGREMSNLKDTALLCGEDCTGRSDCLSFEWSPRTKVCSCNRAAEPTAGPFEDYAFCQRLPAAPEAPEEPQQAAPASSPPDASSSAAAGKSGDRTDASAGRFGLSVGAYKIIYNALPVNIGPDRSSRIVGHLLEGETVQVLEFAAELQATRVRARIEKPAGWITVKHMKLGIRYAVPQA